MSTNKFEILESPSELRLRIYGVSLEELFRHALQAMFESIETNYVRDSHQVYREIIISAADRDLLLIDFLAEALALSDIYNEAYTDAKFAELTANVVKATIIGQKVEDFDVEIKAVTHHEVHISETNGLFTTDLLLDI